MRSPGFNGISVRAPQEPGVWGRSRTQREDSLERGAPGKRSVYIDPFPEERAGSRSGAEPAGRRPGERRAALARPHRRLREEQERPADLGRILAGREDPAILDPHLA